jgi:hypothetical protein
VEGTGTTANDINTSSSEIIPRVEDIDRTEKGGDNNTQLERRRFAILNLESHVDVEEPDGCNNNNGRHRVR